MRKSLLAAIVLVAAHARAREHRTGDRKLQPGGNDRRSPTTTPARPAPEPPSASSVVSTDAGAPGRQADRRRSSIALAFPAGTRFNLHSVGLDGCARLSDRSSIHEGRSGPMCPTASQVGPAPALLNTNADGHSR